MTPNHLARCAAVLVALTLLPAATVAEPKLLNTPHQYCSNPPAPTGEPNGTTPAYDCYGVYDQGPNGTCVGNEHHAESTYDENGTYQDKPSNGQMHCVNFAGH